MNQKELGTVILGLMVLAFVACIIGAIVTSGLHPLPGRIA